MVPSPFPAIASRRPFILVERHGAQSCAPPHHKPRHAVTCERCSPRRSCHLLFRTVSRPESSTDDAVVPENVEARKFVTLLITSLQNGAPRPIRRPPSRRPRYNIASVGTPNGNRIILVWPFAHCLSCSTGVGFAPGASHVSLESQAQNLACWMRLSVHAIGTPRSRRSARPFSSPPPQS